MSERGELLLTLLLTGLCLTVGGMALLPRLLVREVPIEFEAPDISVAVDGAVVSPGIYRLPFRSRVADAIELAGGLTPAAETSLVDLAAPLGPGDKVFVPYRTAEGGDQRISVNSATVDELEELPGIGPVTARRIVEGRPYSRLQELLQVKGIGEKTLERLQPHVRL
ncbi:MAG TPA: ComEA family DNA-binding protein [Trueperaceae bacterium]